MELRYRQISDEAASNLSWNTSLSRTFVSSLSTAAFSDPNLSSQVHGLDDVLNTVKALSLRRFRYEEIERQDVVGEGETFVVERCVVRNQVLAIKHLKTNLSPDEVIFRRRLRSVILELRIMRHAPLRSHPNILAVFGYGWNMKATQILPYLLVQYAPYGTLRQYLHHFKSEISIEHKEILLGDVAAAMSALHLCGIVHGDVKLDNVLAFRSWDRPAKCIAKLADFGHSLVISGKEDTGHNYMRYGGTFIYNAPEVHDQTFCPLDRTALHKCDIWAFGLLAWETFLDGVEYVKHVADTEPSAVKDGEELILAIPDRFLDLAKKSIPLSKLNLRGNLIRSVFNMTIQIDPAKRISSLTKLPFMSQWHSAGIQGLKAELALNFGHSEWSYEMFRPENGREIPWEHEEQIYHGLQQTYNNSYNHNGDVAWQLALCHYLGFGRSPDPSSAHQLALTAERLNHPVAKIFAPLLESNGPFKSYSTAITYGQRVVDLFRQSNSINEKSPLVGACCKGDAETILGWLNTEKAFDDNTYDGYSILHFLFTLEGNSQEKEVLESLLSNRQQLLVNRPTRTIRMAHAQWPLRLIGSPLVFAISVGSISTVQKLLSLGADPCSRAFAPDQFPERDHRSKWTPIHVAVQYHCYEILSKLLSISSTAKYESEVPYACALSYSSLLERIAMHGNNQQDSLEKTVSILKNYQDLSATAPYGMTALMQAIDFQHAEVVSALLNAENSLAKAPFRDPQNPDNFHLPIHFAAQLAARRDVPEAIRIMEIINNFSDDINPDGNPPFDSNGRTPLHFAVTGPSKRAATWILDSRPDLLNLKDKDGQTALYYCYSASNADLLLSKGTDINHTDNCGKTALHSSCYRGDLGLVRCLLEKKPILNLKDNHYGTPLHCAIIRGSLDVAIALLEAGAPVDEMDRSGNTPLHKASYLYRHNIIRLLIQHGANTEIKDSKGRTAATIAKSLGTMAGIVAFKILLGDEASSGIAPVETLYAQHLESGLHVDVPPSYHSIAESQSSETLSHELDVNVGVVELIDYAGAFEPDAEEDDFNAEVENEYETETPGRKLAEFVYHLTATYGISLAVSRGIVRSLADISATKQTILTEDQFEEDQSKLRPEDLEEALHVLRKARDMVYQLCHVSHIAAERLIELEDVIYAQRSDGNERDPWYSRTKLDILPSQKSTKVNGHSAWYGFARSTATLFELGRPAWQVWELDDTIVNRFVTLGKLVDHSIAGNKEMEMQLELPFNLLKETEDYGGEKLRKPRKRHEKVLSFPFGSNRKAIAY